MARSDDWKEAKAVSYSPPKSGGGGSPKPSGSGGSIRAANDDGGNRGSPASKPAPVKYTPPTPQQPARPEVIRQSSFNPQDQGSFTTEKEYLLRALQAAVFGPIESTNKPVSFPVNLPNGKVSYPSGPRGNNGYAQPITYNPGGWSGTAGQVIPTDTGYMSPNYLNAYATTTTGGKTYTPGEWSMGGKVMPGATQESLGLVDPREYLAAGMRRNTYGMADPYTAWQTRQDYMRQRYQTPKRMGLNMPDWMVGVGDLRGAINWNGDTPDSGSGGGYGGGYRRYGGGGYRGYSSGYGDYAKTLYPENGSGGYAPNGYGNADFFASLTNWRI